MAIAGQQAGQVQEQVKKDAGVTQQTPQVRQQQWTADAALGRILSVDMEKLEFARRMGEKFEICFAVHQIVADYRNLRDEGNYRKWEQIEIRDCANSGFLLPR